MKKIRTIEYQLLTLLLTITYSSIQSQTLKRAEYFFDGDPGKGNGTSLSVIAGAAINQTYSLNIGSLSQGPHTFSYRVLDSNGHWSHAATRSFFIITPTVFVNATKIKKAEYFFDHDPGTGSATALAISASSSENNSFVINIGSLATGFHQLNVRYQDDLGRWSHFAQRTFYIIPTVSNSISTVIKKAEYFFEHDPGIGNGKPLAVSSSNLQDNLFTIDISTLGTGFHQLGVRYQDNLNRWTLFTNRTFYIVPSANLVSSSGITKAEYFFDHDPGNGNGKPLTISTSSSENNNFTIDISSLPPGFHQLAIRYKDNLNRWSSFVNRTFYIFSGSILPATLVKVEYYIDNDPGFDKGTSLSFTHAAQLNQQFNIDLTGVPNGSHMLYVRAKDSKGYWSNVSAAAFTILNCTPPTPPTIPTASRCGTGTVTLTASGASGSQVYRWYADATTSNVSFTGATYTTPTISSNTTYYTTIYDPTTLCESSRTQVTASIVNIPKPTLNLTGSLAVCAGNSVALTAPSGFASYTWSNGLSGVVPTIVASASGNYSVTVSDGTCTSPSSDPFVFTVNPLPPKPTINATGGGTLCGGGSVSLSAPIGYATYSWSSGQSVSPISVISPGDFFVTVTDANGCQSVPSDVFAVTTSAPAKPVIVVNGNTSLCNGSTVDLFAPSGFSSYSWSDGSHSPSISPNTAGSYTVTVSNGSCSSPSSDPVVVTSYTTPSKPTVTITGSAVLCNNSFVGLSAPSGYSFYVWSDSESSKQIVVSTAGNYSVQVGNALNCLSQSSDDIAVSLSGQPCGSGGNPANTPPKIAAATIEVPVQTEVVYDVKSLITKGSIGIDYSTLRVAQDPPSGGKASIDADYNLILDYSSLLFVGKEKVDIQVCDSMNSCTQQSLDINVVANIEAFNAVSSEQDGKNDFFYLKFVDQIEETKSNKVTIVDRWGNKVFTIDDYNNNDRVFRGQDSDGKELESGIYFYRIDFNSGRETQTGFISLKR